MKYAYLWALLPLVCSMPADSGPADAGPLFLSPLIKAGNFTEARKKSSVEIFKNFSIPANASSGYITVNNNSNHLFFLFVEAVEKHESAPLLLWTQGGPGLSALFGLLLENGPLALDPVKNLSRREDTIQKHVNVIYLDAPVGAGFSFTNGTTYSKSLADITADIVQFLKQFLELFKEYQGRDFYTAGESYAARYSVALGDYMLRCPGEANLAFRGTIGGVGFLAPILDLADSSDFLFQVSMLDKEGYKEFKHRFEVIRNITYINKNNTLAVGLLSETLFAYPNKETLFKKLTLYNNHASPLYTEMPQSMLYFFAYANSNEFKQAIHVGNMPLQYDNKYLLLNLAGDYLVDITNSTEYVLNNARVLFYTGQLDALFPSVNLQAYFENLRWKNAGKYRNASRLSWKPHGTKYTAAGYTKSAGNFTSAVVIGMGHYAGLDKPLETYLLMRDFLNRSISFSPQ